MYNLYHMHNVHHSSLLVYILMYKIYLNYLKKSNLF
jgi:hypothetical protein